MRLREFYGEAPRFFRRKVFEFLGGYNETLVTGEDFEITQRLRKVGFSIGRCRAMIRHHEPKLSAKRLPAKPYYYGKTLPAYAKKELSLAFKTSSPTRFLKNLPLLKREPACFAGLCCLKLVEYAAYMTGTLVHFLLKPLEKQVGES
jgi:GT2 family glycosyltransferase